ncbi:MAG: hypothetical protein WDW38_007233 [Sanguina aurantia]
MLSRFAATKAEQQVLTKQDTRGPAKVKDKDKVPELSRIRVMKRFGINTEIMPNNTDLMFGKYGIRAITERRVAANTIEAIRRALRRRIKRSARLWLRIRATIPVTTKSLGIRMGKGKGAIAFYATPVRPGQIIIEMDRISRKVAMQAMVDIQPKFPCRLGFVEYS